MPYSSQVNDALLKRLKGCALTLMQTTYDGLMCEYRGTGGPSMSIDQAKLYSKVILAGMNYLCDNNEHRYDPVEAAGIVKGLIDKLKF